MKAICTSFQAQAPPAPLGISPLLHPLVSLAISGHTASSSSQVPTNQNVSCSPPRGPVLPLLLWLLVPLRGPQSHLEQFRFCSFPSLRPPVPRGDAASRCSLVSGTRAWPLNSLLFFVSWAPRKVCFEGNSNRSCLVVGILDARGEKSRMIPGFRFSA